MSSKPDTKPPASVPAAAKWTAAQKLYALYLEWVRAGRPRR